ncbi:MAG: asparagine synthase (glutamine-hydrolyzing) [Sulfurovaceae bacterium]|nr:asparagine synthase (glutamine-hydrolyzing) [Sulfurovaceae bacterium]
MCAIFGIIGSYDNDKAKDDFMALAHRGEDDYAFVTNEKYFFGIHRLAITSYGKDIDQPFIDEDYTVVFNGEIYNYKELALTLGIDACSEAKVILESYKFWGDSFVEQINGMFAIAIYDGNELKLFRDNVGKKPIFYSLQNGTLWFASEIKALKNDLPMDKKAILPYLSFQTTLAPNTFYTNIFSLPAGSFLRFKDGEIIIKSHFLPLKNKIIYTNSKDATSAIKDAFKESVSKRIPESNIPWGALLSGGIDSSLVAAMASVDNKIDTFCIGYEDRFASYDEREYASKVARHIGSNHHEAILTKEKFFDTINEVEDVLDQPLGDPASIPLFSLLKDVKEYGKRVVLTGDGSDELFLGYKTYKEYHDIEQASQLKYKNWLQGFLRSHYSPNKEWEWYKRVFGDSLLFRSTAELFTDLQQNRLLKQNVKDDNSLHYLEAYWQEFVESRRTNMIDWYSFCDMKVKLGDLFLTKLDRISMACGIEARSPFLDKAIVKLAFSVDPNIRFGDTSKFLIKQIAYDYLSSDIVERKKRGFSYPYMEWLLEENELEIIRRVQRERKIFNNDTLEFILSKAPSGGFKHHIFALYMLCRWLERN